MASDNGSLEIRELRAALKVLIGHNPGSEAFYNDSEELDNRGYSSSSCYSPTSPKSSSAESSFEEAQPIWDYNDCVYRCLCCAFEVCQGYCQNPDCDAEYDMEDVYQEYGDPENDNTFRVVATDDTSLRSSRQATPRGSTPLLEVDPRHEFAELLARGATVEMCERFSLQFIPTAGITAWLDEDFIEEFVGPGMQNCQRWMLFLGRRVCLRWDDEDGSIFLTDFLEEALVYPSDPNESLEKPRFETYFSEYEDAWVTQPRSLTWMTSTTDDELQKSEAESIKENTVPNGDTKMPTLYRDEYENVSEDDFDDADDVKDVRSEEDIKLPDVVVYTKSQDSNYDPSNSTEETDDSDVDLSVELDELLDLD